MTENKLKPCPFCGGELMINKMGFDEDGEKICSIRCKRCYRQFGSIGGSDPDAVIRSAYNRAAGIWISVKDGMPEAVHKKTIDDYVYWDSDPVAVVTVDDIGDRSIGVGIYYTGNEDGRPVAAWDGFTVEDVGLYNCTVTHWRPLPKLPEVEE